MRIGLTYFGSFSEWKTIGQIVTEEIGHDTTVTWTNAYGYDDNGNLTSRICESSGNVAETTTYAYDAYNRRIGETQVNTAGESSFKGYEYLATPDAGGTARIRGRADKGSGVFSAANLGWTWVWYVAGIALGAAIITVFALFERKRNQMNAWVEELKSWAE